MAKFKLVLVVCLVTLVQWTSADEYGSTHSEQDRKSCAFIPDYMRASDVRRSFRDGSQYRMRCTDGRRLFVATCSNGAWIFEPDYCKGPLPVGGLFGNLFGPIQAGYNRPPPRPSHQSDPKPVDHVSYTKKHGISTGSPVLDGLVDALQNLFIPFTTPREEHKDLIQVEDDLFGTFNNAFNDLFNLPGDKDIDDYKRCSYDPTHIRPQDGGRSFGHGYNYRSVCKNDPHRYYYGTCRDGVWDFNEHSCTNGHYDPFGNIFTVGADGSGLFSGLNDALSNLFNFGQTHNADDYEKCAYDPTRMTSQYSGRTFSHGHEYRAVCEGYTDRYYYLKCNNGQWMFETKTCTSPGPHGSSFFDNFAAELRNLFGPFLGGSSREPHGDYSNCPYNPLHIRAEDGGKTFYHGYQYTVKCKQYSDRHYHGMCNDGQWIFNEDACENPSHGGDGSFLADFASSLNDLFSPFLGGSSKPKEDYRSCPYNPNHIKSEHSGKTFHHGYRYTATCRQYPDRHYHGVCRDGSWTFYEDQCSASQSHQSHGGGSDFLGGLTSGLENIFSGANNLFSSPGPGENCAYDPAHFNHEDSVKTFYHGYTYRTLCKGYTDRYYVGKCNNGQWTYDQEGCSQDPSEGQQSGTNILDGFASTLQNVFSPIFGSRRPSGDYSSCPYDPRHHKPEHSANTFSHGYRIRVMCEGTTGLYYDRWCDDGQWRYNDRHCTPTRPIF